MPTTAEMSLIYRAADQLKRAHLMTGLEDVSCALQQAMKLFPVDFWVWKLRNHSLFNDIDSFAEACVLLSGMSESIAIVSGCNFDQKEFVAQLCEVLIGWVDEIVDGELLRYDDQVAFIQLQEYEKALICRVYRFDFTKVDAGVTDCPDEIDLMLI